MAQKRKPKRPPKPNPQMYDETMYYGLFKHIVLLVVTFGIWELLWIYRVTKYLNCVRGEDYRDPVKKLLLCMFVPFYKVYWIYKSAKRIDKLARSVGVDSDSAALCVILEIFVMSSAPIAPIVMQHTINKILSTTKATAR